MKTDYVQDVLLHSNVTKHYKNEFKEIIDAVRDVLFNIRTTTHAIKEEVDLWLEIDKLIDNMINLLKELEKQYKKYICKHTNWLCYGS